MWRTERAHESKGTYRGVANRLSVLGRAGRPRSLPALWPQAGTESGGVRTARRGPRKPTWKPRLAGTAVGGMRPQGRSPVVGRRHRVRRGSEQPTAGRPSLAGARGGEGNRDSPRRSDRAIPLSTLILNAAPDTLVPNAESDRAVRRPAVRPPIRGDRLDAVSNLDAASGWPRAWRPGARETTLDGEASDCEYDVSTTPGPVQGYDSRADSGLRLQGRFTVPGPAIQR